MRIIRCRKCKQRLFDIDENDCRKITIKFEDKKEIHTADSKDLKSSSDYSKNLPGNGTNLIYYPSTTSVEHICPRCKLKLLISLATGFMKEIETK